MSSTNDNQANAREKVEKALSRDNLSNVIQPVRMEKNSDFEFRCHPGVSCFTNCCRNMNIILTPFDIIRLKKRLGLPSDLFLKLYTEPEILVESGLPVARLKMLDESGGKCPFVTPEGCQVYSDRPVCCRYYPIGIANLMQVEKESGQEEEFFFLIKENHCKGFEEKTCWTVDSWRADQEADLYDRMNKGWLKLLLRKKSFGEDTELPPRARELFFMATTNMESFRRFVFESRFLDTYNVNDEIVNKIRENDFELMQFAFEYLKNAMFGAESPVIKIREQILKKTVDKIIKTREKNKKLKKGKR
jgi:Fe-S-cluster containining protein